MNSRKKFLGIVLAMIVTVPVMFAAETWTGATNNDWMIASNWSGNKVPTSTDGTLIPSGLSVYPVISYGAAETQNFTMEAGVSVSMTGGTLSVYHDWKNAGTFNATGGSVIFAADAGNCDWFSGTNQFYNIIVNPGVDPNFDDDANGKILIRGNFTNNNTALNVSTNATFTFNGTDDQTIYSASTGSNATFGNLTINKASGALTLNSAVKVGGSVALQSGKMSLSSYDLTVSGAITGASASSYFVTEGTGRLVRPVGSGAAVEFPVGTSSSYNPATIRTGSGTDNYSVGVSPANYSSTVQRTWNISEAVPGGNGTVTVTTQWNSGEQGPSFNRTLAEGWVNTGSGWVMQPGSLTSITAAPTYPAVATFQTTTFSNWTIGNNAGPLPIQLSRFGAVTISRT